MKRRYRATAALGLGLFGMLAEVTNTNAAELRVSTARLIATVLREAGSEFERETGHKLKVTEIYGPTLAQRLAAGESLDADVVILRMDYIDAFIKEGKLLVQTRADLVRTGLGVEVQAGATKPDIGSVEAFKRALLNARSIAYLKNGIESSYLDRLLEQLDISDAVKGKLTRPDIDIVSSLTAKGEIELGIAIITQIVTTPGVELVGPLPDGLQRYYAFGGAVSATSKVPDAAMALIRFLKGPAAIPVIRSQGMEPG